jgi:hypothetical protein
MSSDVSTGAVESGRGGRLALGGGDGAATGDGRAGIDCFTGAVRRRASSRGSGDGTKAIIGRTSGKGKSETRIRLGER